MSFALNPDGGPPRLVRFVTPDGMPSPDTIAILDHRTNVLRVNEPLFAQLSKNEQESVLRTHLPAIEIVAT